MRKNRLLLIVVLLISFTVTLVWVGYRYLYPKLVAEAIVSKKYTSIIPQNYRKEFDVLSDTINSRFSKVIAITEDNGITIDDLLKAVDQIEEQDVRDALEELYNTELESVEQVYMIGRKHIDFHAFDPDLLKSSFLEHVKMHHIERGLKYIKRHDLENKIDAESGRRITKQIIIQKKDKIMKKSAVTD